MMEARRGRPPARTKRAWLGVVTDTVKRLKRANWSGMAIATMACAMVAGCAATRPADAGKTAAQAAARSDRHVYVTSSGLPESCYHDLGEVSFKEPYFQSVIDSDDDKTYARLRDIAQEKYGDDVDAVVDVVKRQNEVGTEVKITGDAVRLQKGETVECAVRTVPGVLDTAGAVAAGGMTGTLVGGLLSGQNSAPGAMMGGYFGAATEAGIQGIKHQQEKQAFQADLDKQIKDQSVQITSLRKELDDLIQRQCEREEMTAAQCDERRAEVENSVVAASEPAAARGPGTVQTTATSASANAAPTGATTAAGAGAADANSPDAGAPPTSFDIQNQIQEQQETIHRLDRAITNLGQQMNAP